MEGEKTKWIACGTVSKENMYLAVMGYTGLYGTELGCTWLYWTVMGCTGLYWAAVEVDSIGLCLAVLGYTGPTQPRQP